MNQTAQSTSHQSSGRRFVRLAALFVVLVAAASGYLFWWSQPTAFGGWGNKISSDLSVGRTINVDMGWPRERVSLHSARPVIVSNSADAEIELVVCKYKTSYLVGADVVPLDRYCSSISPIRGHDLGQFSETDESIVARITARRPGVIQLDGMQVNYSRGAKHLWQTGDEQAGIGISLTAR